MAAVNVLADIRKFVSEVTGKAEKEFKAEKAAIGADVRAELAKAEAAVKAETPTLAADAQKVLDALVKAAEAALLSHGV
jgi:F0F1-type ATP synthase membrane subunit b/b'